MGRWLVTLLIVLVMATMFVIARGNMGGWDGGFPPLSVVGPTLVVIAFGDILYRRLRRGP